MIVRDLFVHESEAIECRHSVKLVGNHHNLASDDTMQDCAQHRGWMHAHPWVAFTPHTVVPSSALIGAHLAVPPWQAAESL